MVTHPPAISRWLGLAGLVFTAGLLGACGGGSDDDPGATSVSIGFSDAPVDDAAKVVITVDTLTFTRAGADDVVVDTFTSDELGIVDAETFQIDLLEVQGNDYKLVLDSVMLEPGNYSNLRIGVLDEDVNLSFVEETDTGLVKPLKVPSDELKLGQFTIGPASTQTFIVEFGVRRGLVYNPGPPGQDRYLLKPRSVRIVELAEAATISGTVDLEALHGPGTCSDKPDPTVGNMAYLYSGHGLDTTLLGDVFVREEDAEEGEEFDPDVPADAIGPMEVTMIDGDDGSYAFSFLPAGDYTLALSCLASDDDPVIFDDIIIPAPATEIVELSFGVDDVQCDFPLVDGACANQ